MFNIFLNIRVCFNVSNEYLGTILTKVNKLLNGILVVVLNMNWNLKYDSFLLKRLKSIAAENWNSINDIISLN